MDHDEQRFLKKVTKTRSCWLWNGASTKDGYGRFLVEGRKEVAAHRNSWRLYRGDTNGLFVLHRCDVRACVNPAHLFLGGHNENMKDMADKGRRLEKHIKYSTDEVRQVRSLRDMGVTYQAIADQTGMSPTHAFYVCTKVKRIAA